jgi:polyhydroxyalkanoate synthesis regulator phasin
MTIAGSTAIVTTLPIRGQDGSASTPAFSFSGDTNNGMYRITTDVIGFATNSTERVRLQTPSTTVGAMRVTVPAVNNTYNVEFFNGTAAVGRISTTSTATTYSTSSDYRLKKDIVEMDSLEAINKIMQLRPVDFKWKIDDHESNGFIAHELQEVFPEAVSGIKDQTVEVGNVLDSEGNIISENIQKPAEIKEDEQWVKIKDEEIYQGVDTSFLVATLVKAVQAQQETIQELKARIEALEN